MIDPIPLDVHADGRARGLWRWKTVALAAAAAAALTAWLTLQNRRDGTAGAATAGRITRITSEPGLELDPALSPDGQTLAYSAGPPGRTRILLRQLATGQTRPLIDAGFEGGQRWPQWSADGSPIVFQAGSPQLEEDTVRGRSRLYVVPAHGGVPRPVLESTPPPFAFAPAWFPNQKDLVFSGGNGIFAVAAGGNGTPRRLVPGSDVHSPRWSPDGRELVIHAIRNGQRDVLVISADGAGSERVATRPVHEQHAGWGPDGNSIVFDAPPKPGERDQAFVVTRAKPGAPWGPPLQITSNGSADPKWSPDGRLIAFCANARFPHFHNGSSPGDEERQEEQEHRKVLPM